MKLYEEPNIIILENLIDNLEQEQEDEKDKTSIEYQWKDLILNIIIDALRKIYSEINEKGLPTDTK